jgi:hypothetical protein
VNRTEVRRHEEKEESSMEAGSQGRCGRSKSMPFFPLVSWYPTLNSVIVCKSSHLQIPTNMTECLAEN